MSRVDDLCEEMDNLRYTNEQLQQELYNLTTKNQILIKDRNDQFRKVVDLEFKIAKYGAVPKSLAKWTERLGLEIEEVKENEGESIKEYVVTKIRACRQLLERKKYLRNKINKTEEGKSILEENYSELEEKYLSQGRELNKVVKGRLIHLNKNNPDLYEILEYVSFEWIENDFDRWNPTYDIYENVIKIRKIYDTNEILIDFDQDFHNYSYIYPKEIFTQTVFLTSEEEAMARLEMQKECHVVKINYHLDSSIGEPKFVPISIYPTHLRMKDYYCVLNNQETEVICVRFGIHHVKFEVVKVEPNKDYISMQDIELKRVKEVKQRLLQAMQELEILIKQYNSQKLETKKEVQEASKSLKSAEQKINSLLGDDIKDKKLIKRAKKIVEKSSKTLRLLSK